MSLKKEGKQIAKAGVRILEVLVLPIVYPAALLLKLIRTVGLWRLPILRKTLQKVGVLPIRDHYYEPLINISLLSKPLSSDRNLPGLNFNISEQRSFLDNFRYENELKDIPFSRTGNPTAFYFDNIYFTGVDAGWYYSLIRSFAPKNIIEIGSGYSTLLALHASSRNVQEGKSEAKILSIEPYENPWLEKTAASTLRKKIEETDLSVFESLKANDILFIDSSHVIRPQGDVLFEYFEILPRLTSGVFVHIHDIFTPKDYPEDWVVNDLRLWNEQYLVEAFLTMNSEFRIIDALNYLWHHYHQDLIRGCPVINDNKNTGKRHLEPSSLWLIKN
jgi:hypothetical protein